MNESPDTPRPDHDTRLRRIPDEQPDVADWYTFVGRRATAFATAVGNRGGAQPGLAIVPAPASPSRS